MDRRLSGVSPAARFTSEKGPGARRRATTASQPRPCRAVWRRRVPGRRTTDKADPARRRPTSSWTQAAAVMPATVASAPGTRPKARPPAAPSSGAGTPAVFSSMNSPTKAAGANGPAAASSPWRRSGDHGPSKRAPAARSPTAARSSPTRSRRGPRAPGGGRPPPSPSWWSSRPPGPPAPAPLGLVAGGPKPAASQRVPAKGWPVVGVVVSVGGEQGVERAGQDRAVTSRSASAGVVMVWHGAASVAGLVSRGGSGRRSGGRRPAG
jgi:hypothetical protein